MANIARTLQNSLRNDRKIHGYFTFQIKTIEKLDEIDYIE